ncbi:RNA-binding protein [Devosia sp.]|uniref:RNA-binding protein n=1 Tax=Devosia sp. TaxID=1871048 RepID=UPI002F1A6F2F
MPPRQELTRQCALTREVKPVADLIRFVVSPDGAVVPDTDARAEGRGVWISLGRQAVAEAVRRKAFQKSLKAAVAVPEDLADLTRLRLEQRFTQALSMARKAGQIVTGATKVKTAIEAGAVIALLTATDAAADGRQKLAGALRGYTLAAREAGMEPEEAPHLELLDSDQLGLALGLENVIHAALVKGAAAEAALKRAERLARYLAN